MRACGVIGKNCRIFDNTTRDSARIKPMSPELPQSNSNIFLA